MELEIEFVTDPTKSDPTIIKFLLLDRHRLGLFYPKVSVQLASNCTWAQLQLLDEADVACSTKRMTFENKTYLDCLVIIIEESVKMYAVYGYR